MATCNRGGVIYKRHQYAAGITEVDGVTQSQIVCKACGKVQTGSIIEFTNLGPIVTGEIMLDNGTEVL
jgi:hypothetical protein